MASMVYAENHKGPRPPRGFHPHGAERPGGGLRRLCWQYIINEDGYRPSSGCSRSPRRATFTGTQGRRRSGERKGAFLPRIPPERGQRHLQDGPHPAGDRALHENLHLIPSWQGQPDGIEIFFSCPRVCVRRCSISVDRRLTHGKPGNALQRYEPSGRQGRGAEVSMYTYDRPS